MNSLTTTAVKLFDELNWPSVDDEAWRRTDISRLLPKGFLDKVSVRRDAVIPGEFPSGQAPLLPEGYAGHIITEGGIPVSLVLSSEAIDAGLMVEWASHDDMPAALKSAGLTELSSKTDRITVWHWRDMPGSLIVRVPPQTRILKPLVVEERLIAPDSGQAAFSSASTPHVHVEAGENSDVSVVWSLEGSPDPSSGTPIVNAGLSALAGPNARVSITIRQNLGGHVVFFLHDLLSSNRDSRIEFNESHLGGALVKTRARAVLAAPGGDAKLKGLFVAGAGRHMDIGTLQEHQAPHTTSNALYKGAVRPGGRSVFQGLIEVAPQATGTDAYLTNKNLVLGDGARADSLPQLDILTNDVKCSHGSTTAKLNEDQLFYLRSRGFAPDEAKEELTRGFLLEVIDKVPPAVSKFFLDDLDEELAGT